MESVISSRRIQDSDMDEDEKLLQKISSKKYRMSLNLKVNSVHCRYDLFPLGFSGMNKSGSR